MAEGTRIDVIVVGGGGSGLAAAVAAAEAGARVVVLEKADTIGGSTIRSVGAFTAPLTSYQRAAGISDSIEEFVADIRTTNGPREERENVELRRIFAENAATTMEWLHGLGVRFLGPFPEPPHRVPRLHNVMPNSGAYGAALAKRARRLGVEVRVSSPVTGIGTTDAGWAVRTPTGTVQSRSVVIASGDFSADVEVLESNIGSATSAIPAVNPWNTGDGQRLGVAAGGTVTQMDTVFEGLRYVPRKRRDLLKAMPPAPWFARLAAPIARRMPRPLFELFVRGALVGWLAPTPEIYEAGAVQVDSSGRLLDHDGTPPSTARAVAAAGNRSYAILDATAAAVFSRGGAALAAFPGVATAHLEDVRRHRRDLIVTAAMPRELAARIGVDPAVLEQSLADAPGRPLTVGPFTALGPLEAVIILANGGLRIDADFRVLDAHDRPVPGLYAAGSAGQGGLQLLNNGLHIGWALTSGRLAGDQAARSGRHASRRAR